MSAVAGWAREFAVGFCVSMAMGVLLLGLTSGAGCSDWNCRPAGESLVETGTYAFACGTSPVRGAGVQPVLSVDREAGLVTFVYSFDDAAVRETWRIDDVAAW